MSVEHGDVREPFVVDSVDTGLTINTFSRWQRCRYALIFIPSIACVGLLGYCIGLNNALATLTSAQVSVPASSTSANIRGSMPEGAAHPVANSAARDAHVKITDVSAVVETAVVNLTKLLTWQRPVGARHALSKSLIRPTSSYTRSCTMICSSAAQIGPCSPPGCSLPGDIDLGVDLVDGVNSMSYGAVCKWSRICVSTAGNSQFRAGDADGNPIICSDEAASVGGSFNKFDGNKQWTAEETSFASIDLWGGGGGGSGAKRVSFSEDGDSFVISSDVLPSVSGIYLQQGETASGRKWYARQLNQNSNSYQNQESNRYTGRRRSNQNPNGYRYQGSNTYMYWDPDCSGYGFGAGWFIGSQRPDPSARSNLIRFHTTQNICQGLFFIRSESAEPPLGTLNNEFQRPEGEAKGSINIRKTRSEVWVCGGGGGGAAHVRALVEFKAGHTYRVEIGRGGQGSKAGRVAKAGQSTRLVEVMTDSVVKVLAEAAGGFGAGAFNEEYMYTPGGRAGFSAVDEEVQFENNPGIDGDASWVPRLGASLLSKVIRSPTSLVRTAYGNKLGAEWETLPNSELHVRTGSRLPCGDRIPRVGCKPESAHDYFLTCNDGFDLGANGSHCYGVACINVKGYCLPHGDVTSSPLQGSALFRPVGGSVVGPALLIASGIGKGGDGRCPILHHTTEISRNWRSANKLVPGSPTGQPGFDGSSGLAAMQKCRRIGPYTLALQICEGSQNQVAAGQSHSERTWTLHGLWPEGVSDCAGEEFQMSQIVDIQDRLAAKWPSCRIAGTTSEEFWAHEWKKHGVCTGLSQHSFFTTALRLLEQHSEACAAVIAEECRLCLTKDFNLCAGLRRSI